MHSTHIHNIVQSVCFISSCGCSLPGTGGASMTTAGGGMSLLRRKKKHV